MTMPKWLPEYSRNAESVHLLMETPEGRIVSRTLGPFSVELRFSDIQRIGLSTDGEAVRYVISACLKITSPRQL